jgi:hypothetical protein
MSSSGRRNGSTDVAPEQEPDPTRADFARLAWILLLLWLSLAGFVTVAQRFLGWHLAAGLIGGAGALFTLGIALVIAGDLAGGALWRWWRRR